MQPGMDSEYEFEGKTVYRHLQDGDVVLVNRQVFVIETYNFFFNDCSCLGFMNKR